MELYIHIPFCRQKCRYCAFTSFVGKEAEAENYVSLILQEARKSYPDFTEKIETVYIGGGTPSLLPEKELKRMILELRHLLPMDSVTEFTSEANPGAVSEAWLRTACESGVNRLSFGMQAYQPALLALLGRIHQFEDVRRSVSAARNAGIGNISLDLIFGIPGQTLSDWRETLDAALSLHPDHISAYGLIPEENTPLYADLAGGRLSLPEPEQEREMYDVLLDFLSAAGFTQYEISSFARAGRSCRHNIGYWTQLPYLGLGVSAVSMRLIQSGPGGMVYERRSNPCTLEGYRRMVLEELPEPETERIDEKESRFETMMLGLRMNRGVSEEAFRRLHGTSLEQCYGEKLRAFEKQGLMQYENGAWKMTRRGFDLQNTVLVELMDP